MIIFKPHRVLEYVKPYLPDNPIIIEAGAFDGTDTIRLAKQWPHGTIHTFEPVPALYNNLIKNTAVYPNIHCYHSALSNQNGTAPFYVSEKKEKKGTPSQAGSLRRPKERLDHSSLHFPYTIQVPTITLDTWADQQTISHIDFIWLDIQGQELAVLQASPHIFATLKVIYLEVSFIESYAGQPLYQDVAAWLTKQKFEEIGKDFTNTTDWFFGNTLWVKK